MLHCLVFASICDGRLYSRLFVTCVVAVVTLHCCVVERLPKQEHGWYCNWYDTCGCRRGVCLILADGDCAPVFIESFIGVAV